LCLELLVDRVEFLAGLIIPLNFLAQPSELFLISAAVFGNLIGLLFKFFCCQVRWFLKLRVGNLLLNPLFVFLDNTAGCAEIIYRSAAFRFPRFEFQSFFPGFNVRKRGSFERLFPVFQAFLLPGERICQLIFQSFQLSPDFRLTVDQCSVFSDPFFSLLFCIE